jgi:hypothetical protein
MGVDRWQVLPLSNSKGSADGDISIRLLQPWLSLLPCRGIRKKLAEDAAITHFIEYRVGQTYDRNQVSRKRLDVPAGAGE